MFNLNVTLRLNLFCVRILHILGARMLRSAQTLAARQLRELRSDVRLVVVHPNFAAQHTLIESLGGNYCYLRFDGLRLEREQLWAQFDAAWAEQQPGTDAYIVLDECDRAEPDALIVFLRRLVERHVGRRILLLTRETPNLLLRDTHLSPLTALIPINQSSMFWDYTGANGQPSALLEVYALGAGRALLNGKAIDDWDGVLPRALFFYMVDRGMVTRGEIFATFWPNLPVKEATNVFHVTKRKINEVLQIDLTVYGSGFYHVSPEIHLSYDVAVFNQLLQDAAIAAHQESEELLMKALGLYRGDFLNQVSGEWVLSRRLSMRHAQSEALLGLGRIVQERGEAQQALSLYLRACRADRAREDATEAVMRLFAALDQRDEALNCYDNLRAELMRTTGGSPSDALQVLAASIRDY